MSESIVKLKKTPLTATFVVATVAFSSFDECLISSDDTIIA